MNFERKKRKSIFDAEIDSIVNGLEKFHFFEENNFNDSFSNAEFLNKNVKSFTSYNVNPDQSSYYLSSSPSLSISSLLSDNEISECLIDEVIRDHKSINEESQLSITDNFNIDNIIDDYNFNITYNHLLSDKSLENVKSTIENYYDKYVKSPVNNDDNSFETISVSKLKEKFEKKIHNHLFSNLKNDNKHKRLSISFAPTVTKCIMKFEDKKLLSPDNNKMKKIFTPKVSNFKSNSNLIISRKSMCISQTPIKSVKELKKLFLNRK